MYAEFDLLLKMTSDPSHDDLDGDLCDFRWLEDISKQEHVLNVPLVFPTDGQRVFPLSTFIVQPKMLILKTDGAVEVGLGSAARSVEIEVVNGRFGYMVLSAPSVSDNLYITASAGTSVTLSAIGDDQ